MTHVSLWLPAPTPWRREPQITTRGPRPRLYPHPDTVAGMARWRAAWLSSERVYVDGPVDVALVIYVLRPAAHHLRSGGLSAEGRAKQLPIGRPDLDNCCKLVLDALKGLAFADDASVVTLKLSKRYTLVAGGAALAVVPHSAEK